jgi:hypothetical protein
MAVHPPGRRETTTLKRSFGGFANDPSSVGEKTDHLKTALFDARRNPEAIGTRCQVKILRLGRIFKQVAKILP